MAAIDIGPGATDRSTVGSATDLMHLAITNPANASGKLTTFEIWCNTTCYSVKMGTFYGSSTSWTSRDHESLGTVASGSKQTFTGLDCLVEKDDIIGSYISSGSIEKDTTGSYEVYWKTGDWFGAGTQTYTVNSVDVYSLYGTGETVDGIPFFKEFCGGLNIDMTGGL